MQALGGAPVGILRGVRPDLKMMLRGLGKFVAVALAAGLGGAAIGIGLAELTGDDAQTPTTTATTSAQAATTGSQTETETQTTQATQTETTPARTSTTNTSTTAPPRGRILVPRVEILSARLADGLVTARVRVTNRYSRPLKLTTPALVSGEDEVPLDDGGRDGARALLTTLDPGEDATGELRFTTPSAVAQRLADSPRARLKIAGRTVSLALDS